MKDEDQELYLNELISWKGWISRANYRALSILLFGIGVCIFFLPGFIAVFLKNNKLQREALENQQIIELIGPTIYLVGYSILI